MVGSGVQNTLLHQEVDATKLVDHPGHQIAHLIVHGVVHPAGNSTAAFLGHQVGSLPERASQAMAASPGRPPSDHHRCPSPTELDGDALADPTTCASHDSDHALEPHVQHPTVAICPRLVGTDPAPTSKSKPDSPTTSIESE